jgi:hypothetical protein
MLLIVAMFALAPLALGVLTAVDASHLPDWAFERAGTSKTLWIVLPLVSLVACFVGAIVVAIVWFASTRARVISAAGQLPPPSIPPPPGGAWQPPPPSRPW